MIKSLLTLIEQINLEELLKHLKINLQRLKGWTPEQRSIRYEKSKEIIPEKQEAISQLTKQLCYNRNFCNFCGINYSDIKEEDYILIKSAIADHLLNEIDK